MKRPGTIGPLRWITAARRVFKETSRELFRPTVDNEPHVPRRVFSPRNQSGNFEDPLMKTSYAIGETIENGDLEGEKVRTLWFNGVADELCSPF